MLEESAKKYYSQGYNCAETMLLAGNEAYHLHLDSSTVRLFSAFGGGLQSGDLCGCLLGAAGVISALYVETKAHDTKEIKKYTQILIREFEKEMGGRKCMEIKPRLYSKEVKCSCTVVCACKVLENTIRIIQQQWAQES